MTPIEKIKLLKKKKEEQGYGGKYFLDIRARESKWTQEEINTLKKEYPWLPSFYLDFIREFDTLGLAWVSFFGSKGCGILPLENKLEFWKDQIRGEYFPFGKDADGSIYAFNKKGNVIYFDVEDYEWEKPIYTANSLEEFIDECLLGKRYAEFNILEDDTFYDFLQDQNWV